jgi:hypothetical protein
MIILQFSNITEWIFLWHTVDIVNGAVTARILLCYVNISVFKERDNNFWRNYWCDDNDLKG